MPWSAALLTTTSGAIYWESLPILLPSSAPRPLSPRYIDRAHQLSSATTGLYLPGFLSQLVRNPEATARLAHLKTVLFAGSPLDPETGSIIAKYCKIQSLLGSTEIGGAYPILLSNDLDDWQWMRFADARADPQAAYGCTFEPFADELYDFVMYRQQDPLLPIFAKNPDMNVYRTNDLWRKHSTKAGYWQPAGRADDFVKLADLTKFNAIDIENAIEYHARGLLNACVVGGTDRPSPFVLVQLTATGPTAEEMVRVLEKIWQAMELVNARLASDLQLRRQLIVVADPAKPLTRTLKGTMERRKALTAYAQDIDAAYLRLTD